MSFDTEKFKALFPLFDHPENRSLVYLDNAATTQKPACVINAISEFYSRYNANAHRGSHRLGQAVTTMLEETRSKLAAFLNAKPEEIIFTAGATDSLNLLVQSLEQQFSSSKTPVDILLGTAEHHANLVPWQLMAARLGFKLSFLPNSNETSLTDIKKYLTANTKVLAITAASNVFGFVNDVARLKQDLPDEVLLIVDASQLIAHQNIDVKQLDCDFLFASAHKFFGPTGIGFLYGKQQQLEKLEVVRGGGEIVSQVSYEGPEFVAGPQRFEPGTSSLAATAGLSACLDFWQQQDRQAMRQYEQELLAYCHQQLNSIDQLKVLTQAINNIGICSFVFNQGAYNEFDLVQYLNEKDIALRLGHHCAQPLLASFELDAVVRVSLAAYNSHEDIDHLVVAINEFIALQYPDNSLASLKTFEETHGWQARYKILMDWGSATSSHPEIRADENLVKGCESSAWLCIDENKQLLFDSDSRIVKGLFRLLQQLLESQPGITEQQVLEQYRQWGLEKHLSASRSNGFKALLKRALTLKTSGD